MSFRQLIGILISLVVILGGIAIVMVPTVETPEVLDYAVTLPLWPTSTPWIITLEATQEPTSTPFPLPTVAYALPDGMAQNYPKRDPTFDEMIYFLNHDHVNWNEYVEKGYTYVCHHFACDVCNAAFQQGLRCAYVHVGMGSVAHALVAFETTDQGLIYFEPQLDKRMKVEIGRRYWSWVFLPDWPEYIDYIDYDDTVTSIYLFWNDDSDNKGLPCEWK